MKRQHSYESLIAQKLNRLPAPQVAGLWDGMEAILNKEMPQQPEKKRRPAAWWFSANGLLTATLAVAVVSGAYTLSQHLAEKIIVTDTAALNNNASNAPSLSLSKPAATSQSLPEEANAEPTNAETTKNVEARSDETQQNTRSVGSIVAIRQNSIPFFKANGGNGSKTSLPDPPDVNHTTDTAYEKSKNEEAKLLFNQWLTKAARINKAAFSVLNSKDIKPLTAEEVKQKLSLKKRGPIQLDKGLTIGLALNYPVAIGGQQKSGLDKQGNKNQWQDYVPSVYAQLHFSKKFYAQAEWSPVAAQYTPALTMYDKVEQSNPDEKEEKRVQLNKLYYASFPLSLHYNLPWKGLSVGTGVQYSLLKKIILKDQEYYHVIGPGYWNTEVRKDEAVAKDPSATQHNGDLMSDVAGTFRRQDWRLLADVGYNRKSLTAGLRFTKGLQPYVNSNFTNLPAKDRNEGVQVYLRYNVFDGRKK